MNTEKLFKTFNELSPLTKEAWADFFPLFTSLELTRNEYLVREGSRVSHCYVLTEGVVRVYYNKEGNEYNKTFFTPGMFPTPLTALLSDAPSALSFQALTPCQLIGFSYYKFKELSDKHRCLERIFLKILENVWIKKERHDIQMVTNDATTNYMLFREQFPHLENLIPQYHIASYLGITPIQLSRIRAKLNKSN